MNKCFISDFIGSDECGPTAQADVSVILPHFNATDSVERSIKSVILQTQAVKELIIVDDCSDDYDVLKVIVESFRTQLCIKLIRLDVNSGASEARNQGVILASGRYLAFLDSDDIWHPNKIKTQYSLMVGAGLKFTGHLYVQDVNKVCMGIPDSIQVRKVSPFDFVFGNKFFTPTVMVVRNSFIGFDSRYRRVDDYKCWLVNSRFCDAFVILAPMAGGFKRAIGASGLTSSISLMHKSYLVVLRDLYHDGLVSGLFFFVAVVVEFFKYPIRVIKNRILKMFS